jgi:hypothetical protein
VSHSYYIYYRVDPVQAEAAGPRIKQLLDAVKGSTGIAGRIMRKRGEPNLWMEVYENIADEARFERELAEAVGKLKVAEFLQPGSARQTECFEEP